jgi:hypothetical protein
MRPIAGAYGNSNRDEYLCARKVSHRDGLLKVHLFDGSSHSLPVAKRFSKITLPRIPVEFQSNVFKSRAGGGVVNSRLAAELIAQAVGRSNEIRCLDANKPDPLIASEIPSPTRHLNFRQCPRNYIIGSRAEKWVFRSPIEPAAPLGPLQWDRVTWLCEAQTILINSPKDMEPVKAIVAERNHRRFQIILVLTPSLPAQFWKRLLPAADVVIGAWDELQFVTGEAPVSVAGAALMADRLRRLAPCADMHVTMGKRGVLTMAAGSAEPFHVELDSQTGMAAEAEEIVRERPAHLCGAGDAFAGGVLVRRSFAWSLLSGASIFRPHVQDALAGCASALRWIGVPSRLAVGAFGVRSLPISVAA